MLIKLFTTFFFSFLLQCLKSSSKVLNFTYNGFPYSLPTDISIQGMATVTPNGLLKLTNKTKQNTGHAFYIRPIRFKDSPNDSEEHGQKILLVNWVFEFWMERNILGARDPNIEAEYDQREVEMVLKLGLLCSHPNPQARPTMRHVLHYLKGDATLPNLSLSKFRGGGVMMGIHHELSESAMFTSSMVDSVLSGPR